MPLIQHISAHLTHPQVVADAVLDLQAGQVFNVKAPITFATADAAVLFTVPTALAGPKNVATIRFRLINAHWEVTTSFTGGASSAIGVKSSNTLYTGNGALLGGSTGDVAAGLVSTAPFASTLGTAFAATVGGVILVAGDTVTFQQRTSQFTAGVGFVHLNFQLVN